MRTAAMERATRIEGRQDLLTPQPSDKMAIPVLSFPSDGWLWLCPPILLRPEYSCILAQETLPARFMLAAVMNPHPWGLLGSLIREFGL
jgi:hypothetical protein